HGGAVEADGAGAADAVLAADMRAGEAQRVAQEVRQEQARLDGLAPPAAVDDDVDLDHAAPSCAFRHARSSARSARTPVRWRWYRGDACIVPGGSTAAATSARASRAVSAVTA